MQRFPFLIIGFCWELITKLTPTSLTKLLFNPCKSYSMTSGWRMEMRTTLLWSKLTHLQICFNQVRRLNFLTLFNQLLSIVCLGIIEIISLPAEGELPPDGTQVTLSGWGRTTNTNFDSSPVLLKLNRTVMPFDVCVKALDHVQEVRDGFICTSSMDEKGACNVRLSPLFELQTCMLWVIALILYRVTLVDP